MVRFRCPEPEGQTLARMPCVGINIGHVLVEEPFRMDSERAFPDFTGDGWRARCPHYLVVAGTGTCLCSACRVGSPSE